MSEATVDARARHTKLSVSGTVIIAVLALLAVLFLDNRSAAESQSELRVSTNGTTTMFSGGAKHSRGSLNILSFGDSVPAGHGTVSFLDLLGQQVATKRHTRVAVTNEAVSGYTTSNVLQQLNDPSGRMQGEVRKADAIILEIGANDLNEQNALKSSCAPVKTSGCYSDDMKSVHTNMLKILTEVNSLKRSGSQVIVLGYWNVFRDGSSGMSEGSSYVQQGEALARWMNDDFSALADKFGDNYADVYEPFFETRNVSGYLQSDGDHPNLAGQRLLADATWQVLNATLPAVSTKK